MTPASHGLLAKIQQATDSAAQRFGPHTAEVEAFISAASELTPSQWRRVLAIRHLVASVSKEGAGGPDSARAIQAAIRSSDAPISEPMARAGEVLFDALARRGEEKQVTAWQALTALIMRSQLPALKFGVHYAPFATLVPLFAVDLDPRTRRFIARLEQLTPEGVDVLSQRWRLEPQASRALLQAVAKNRDDRGEQAVALVALRVVPHLLTGDSGWAAVRTAVHGGRVLGAAADLTEADLAELWAPLERVVALASLDVEAEPKAPAGDRGHAGAEDEVKRTRRAPRLPAAAPPPYGPNHAAVAAFIRALGELTPIQWLRVLDRRKLVASVTREGSARPASVVRAILAGLDRTRDFDLQTRCRAFIAVERAAFALEAPTGKIGVAQVRQALAPFAPAMSIERANGSGFAQRLVALDRDEWARIAGAVADANEAATAALVNAGTALTGFLAGRTDDEGVATWNAVSALVHRHHLTPIKFAAAYAPFASAIPPANPKPLGALVTRYVTAVGRLGGPACATLARPWQLDEELSRVLARATADGSARPAEEAAALAAVVTVPMRLDTGGGWAAVKTAAFGGRVISARAKLTPQQLESLWAPIQRAIPLASLNASARAGR